MKKMEPLFNPYYASLNPLQQSLFEILYDGIRDVKAEIDVSAIKCTHDDVTKAIDAIFYDRPGFYWITGAFKSHSVNNVVTTVSPTYNELSGNISQINAEMKKVISSYIHEMPKDNLLKQILYIHDKLVLDVSYEHGKYDQTAYSALIEKKAVCAGYSRAFQLIMHILKVPCYYCYGTARSKKNPDWGRHGWNIIKLGNDYYNIDLTWDDCYGETISDLISYEYFNCTDAKISSNHRRDGACDFLPKCNGTKYDYKSITGITPELHRVLHDGVTIRTVVGNKKAFLDIVTKHMRDNKNKPFTISFPASDRLVVDNASEWFKEAIQTVYNGSIGWKLASNYTDYKNGLFRLELNFTIKK